MSAPPGAPLRLLGATGTASGSRILAEFGERRMPVEGGLFQGQKHLRQAINEPLGREAFVHEYPDTVQEPPCPR